MKEPVTRLDYCQYLLVSQINYTLTHFADHTKRFSHDAINRYLQGERLTPRLVWENVAADVVATPHGYVIFDDTVLDKTSSFAIELVRRQYSGNAGGVIKGIGVVTCVYVNPATDHFWLIDYRLYDPDGDGKTKLDHVRDMLTNIVHHKCLPFHAVLMDTWYATKDLMLFIEALHKVYYCPLKANRQVVRIACLHDNCDPEHPPPTSVQCDRGNSRIRAILGHPVHHGSEQANGGTKIISRHANPRFLGPLADINTPILTLSCLLIPQPVEKLSLPRSRYHHHVKWRVYIES